LTLTTAVCIIFLVIIKLLSIETKWFWLSIIRLLLCRGIFIIKVLSKYSYYDISNFKSISDNIIWIVLSKLFKSTVVYTNIFNYIELVYLRSLVIVNLYVYRTWLKWCVYTVYNNIIIVTKIQGIYGINTISTVEAYNRYIKTFP